jgi:hypothetical protein
MIQERSRSSGSSILEQLQQLTEVYRQEQASELMTRTLDKLFMYEAETCRNQLQQLQSDLANYEHQYDMNSDTFYELFQHGKTDDRMDYVEWASLFQMTQRLKNRLALLTDSAIL